MPRSWTRDPARHLLGVRLRVAKRSGLADVRAKAVSFSTRPSYGSPCRWRPVRVRSAYRRCSG
jgi:hypothetical protein